MKTHRFERIWILELEIIIITEIDSNQVGTIRIKNITGHLRNKFNFQDRFIRPREYGLENMEHLLFVCLENGHLVDDQ